MKKSIEITPQERARLGRDTLLQWSIKENKAKLGALRKEISDYLKSGATDKLEKLRVTIIKNTRKDLEKIKNMTDKERDKKAKEFADKVIRYVKENKDLNDVFFTSRVAIGPEKYLLKDMWLDADPDTKKAARLQPRYEVYKFFKDQDYQKDAFIMLTLIQKKWGMDKALEVWGDIKRKYAGKKLKFYKEHVAFKELRYFFREEKVRDTLGFYYGTNVRSQAWIKKNGKRLKLNYYGKYDPRAIDETKSPFVKSKDTGATLIWNQKWNITGWWTYDEDQGSNDEFTFTHSLNEAIPKISKELKDKRNFDSGIDPEDALKIVEDLEKAKRISRPRKGTLKRDLYKHFLTSSDKYASKWTVIQDEDVLSKLTLLFFDAKLNFADYKYRYFAKQKRLYFIRLKSAGADEENAGGYFKFEKQKLNNYKVLNQSMLSIELKKVVDDMDPKKREKELNKYKIESGESTREDKLEATKGISNYISKKCSKAVEYNQIGKKYLDKFESELKKYLKSRRGFKEEKATLLAAVRTEYVKKEIYDYIKKDDVLSKAVEENEGEIMRIMINTSDEVEVALRDKGKLGKLKAWAKKKAEGVKTTASDVASGTMARLEKKLERFLGPLTPVAMWFLDKYFKVGDIFKKMARGGTSLIGGLLTSALGIKVSKDILKSKKITQEIIEKLPPKKKKYFKFKKKMYFGEDVTLKGKKIVIPKGKGLKPGKKFEVKVKGYTSKVVVLPLKEKKGSLWGIFGRKREQYRLQEKEITIAKGTTIPKGTVIPKGAKIFKT